MPRTTPTQPEATKPTKTLTDGAKTGRALTKLQAIDDAEIAELAQSPTAIRKKYQNRRDELLLGLEPGIKAAVLAAAGAMRPKGEAAE